MPLLTFIIDDGNTGVFHNICQPFFTVAHSTVATWWDHLIGFRGLSPPSSDACRAIWLAERELRASRTCSGGVSISSFLDGCTPVLKGFSAHICASLSGKVKSDSIRRSTAFDILIILFLKTTRLKRPRRSIVTAGTHRTSDLNFVSSPYNNSCISAGRRAFILVSIRSSWKRIDLWSIKYHRFVFTTSSVNELSYKGRDKWNYIDSIVINKYSGNKIPKLYHILVILYSYLTPFTYLQITYRIIYKCVYLKVD